MKILTKREHSFAVSTDMAAVRDVPGYRYVTLGEGERFPQHQMLQTELFTRSAPWRCSRPWDGSERCSRGTKVCRHSLLEHAGVRICLRCLRRERFSADFKNKSALSFTGLAGRQFATVGV